MFKNHMQINELFRGLLQSSDGTISRILKVEPDQIRFETTFWLNEALVDILKNQSEHILFSQRSRIARLGLQMDCEKPVAEKLEKDRISLVMEATAVMPGYPGLEKLQPFLTIGLPVGRLVFCDPQALLRSDEVLDALEQSRLKLPASTSISADGSIVIAPHRISYTLRQDLDQHLLARILWQKDGREILNRFQVPNPQKGLTIMPGQGVITSCSMYLHDHYVVLQRGSLLGRQAPATVLDPVKTRGIRIFLEIANHSERPIVNPLISAKVYRSTKGGGLKGRRQVMGQSHHSYERLREIEKQLDSQPPAACHLHNRPAAIIPDGETDPANLKYYMNGPSAACRVSEALCTQARWDFSPQSPCTHVYATSHIPLKENGKPGALVLKYFPNLIEHRDILNLIGEHRISELYFYQPSHQHGFFLSQSDHHRLEEYHAFGLDVYWVSSLTRQLMVHTLRDGKGYFVLPQRLADFHKSMLFAFYGSNRKLSPAGEAKLAGLLDALADFWGSSMGILTGGGSGVMEHANRLARERGILSGANFIDITDQEMTTEVDFCQVFQSTCRHSRQKWFEIASFPIFNVGGLGSLEELGITLCNMKLAIQEPAPVVLFDTETGGGYWRGLRDQISKMVEEKRAPGWVDKNMVITDDPQTVIEVYRDRLRLV